MNSSHQCKISRLAVKNYTVLKGTMSVTAYQTWSSRDFSLGLETSEDPFLQVLVSVLVLEPQSLGLGLGLGTPSLGLGLGLGTCDHEDSVFVTRIMKREVLLSAGHLCSCGTDI